MREEGGVGQAMEGKMGSKRFVWRGAADAWWQGVAGGGKLGQALTHTSHSTKLIEGGHENGPDLA